MFWSSRVSTLNLCSSLLLCAAFTAVSNPADAQQRYNWTGFSAYAGIGAAKLDADVSVYDESWYRAGSRCYHTSAPATVDGRCRSRRMPRRRREIESAYTAATDSDIGILGTVGVAADVEFSPGFVVGAFADFDKTNANVDFFGSSSFSRGRRRSPTFQTSIEGELELDYSFSIGGRIGMLTPNRQGMIYFLAAYTQAHMQNSSATIHHSVHLPGSGTGHATPISVAMPTTSNGLTLGFGGELKLSNAWSIKAEGRYTNLGSKTVAYRGRSNTTTNTGVYDSGCGGYYRYGGGNNCEATVHLRSGSQGTVKVDPEILSARVVLSYQFN